ncbi:Phasin [Paracoccus jeotgali]|uniref:Phasin n=1 Tax=Paracoccus jeotgali TaxID=2065379 RepID=A0A2K9MED0_9RHOB|nr:Phasin [Paracoccus jeotgali]AUM74007.1 Phasin [Paracoccus jeotgali]
MAKTPDFTKTMQDMMANFPVDTSSMQDAFKSQSALNEKLSRVALSAAERSTEISAQWAKDTIARVGELTAKKDDAGAYAKAFTDFANQSAETAAEHMSAFAEVAKKLQMETVDLLMAAGKDMADDAQKATEKAGRQAQDAVMKSSTSSMNPKV